MPHSALFTLASEEESVVNGEGRRRAENCSFFLHHGNYKMCRKHILSTGLILSVRLISMSSVLFSPYSNTVKIEHLEDSVYRARGKWRVEVIVQIIQAKQNETKSNQLLLGKRQLWEPEPSSLVLYIVQIHQLCIYIYLFYTGWA